MSRFDAPWAKKPARNLFLSLFLIPTHQHTDLARRILSFSMTSQDNISFHVRAVSTVLSKFLRFLSLC